MKHLRKRRDDEDPFKDFAPTMSKDCQSVCDREVVMTKDGPVVVCNGCMRIVMDNRDKK